jgi:hypothetical protein
VSGTDSEQATLAMRASISVSERIGGVVMIAPGRGCRDKHG